jgi:hypothetical protein
MTEMLEPCCADLYSCCGWHICKCAMSPEWKERAGIIACVDCGHERYKHQPCRWCSGHPLCRSRPDVASGSPWWS